MVADADAGLIVARIPMAAASATVCVRTEVGVGFDPDIWVVADAEIGRFDNDADAEEGDDADDDEDAMMGMVSMGLFATMG